VRKLKNSYIWADIGCRIYHCNPWTDTYIGACPSFDLFRRHPTNFFMQRFPGMTLPVADLLANKVFCILDDPTDDSMRISANEFGAWAQDLPLFLGVGPASDRQGLVPTIPSREGPKSLPVPWEGDASELFMLDTTRSHSGQPRLPAIGAQTSQGKSRYHRGRKTHGPFDSSTRQVFDPNRPSNSNEGSNSFLHNQDSYDVSSTIFRSNRHKPSSIAGSVLSDRSSGSTVSTSASSQFSNSSILSMSTAATSLSSSSWRPTSESLAFSPPRDKSQRVHMPRNVKGIFIAPLSRLC
jgi:hypothetical protein